MSEVIVVIGPGLIGQAIARRVGVGKHIVLADLHEASANAAAETLAAESAARPLPTKEPPRLRGFSEWS